MEPLFCLGSWELGNVTGAVVVHRQASQWPPPDQNFGLVPSHYSPKLLTLGKGDSGPLDVKLVEKYNMKVTEGHGKAMIHVSQNKEEAKTILSPWEGSQSLGEHGII